MNRQLIAVLTTYATRRAMQIILGVGGGVYALAIFVMALDQSPGQDRFDSAYPLLMFPAGLIAYLLATHAKWQFVDPRARLLPRFAAPHLAVIAGLAVVGLICLPCLAAIASRLNPLGYLACTIVFASSLIWGIHANSRLATIACMVMIFSAYSTDIRFFWLMPISVARFFPLHLILFLAGWAAFAAWLVRLARLHGELDDYNIPVQAQSGSATRMERLQANRNILRHKLANGLWKGGPSDWWHDRLREHGARSAEQRQRLFRYGFAPIPVGVNAVRFGAVMFTILVVSNWQGPATGHGRAFSVGALAPLVFLPAMFPGQFLAMRRARMSQELLLPFSRRQFIDGILLALTRDTLVTLAVMLAVALVAISVMPMNYPETPNLLAGLALLAAVQPYFFGVATYSALWPSAIARMAIVMAAMMPVSMACAGGIASLQRTGPLPALLIAAAVFPVGVVVVRKSRQAWLNAELA